MIATAATTSGSWPEVQLQGRHASSGSVHGLARAVATGHPSGYRNAATDRVDWEKFSVSMTLPVLDDPIPIPEVSLGNGVSLQPRRSPIAGPDGPPSFSVLLEDGCYTALSVPAVDVAISAYSRDDLASAVQDVLAGLWGQYADAPDDTLWPKAQDLKRRLRNHYEVVR